MTILSSKLGDPISNAVFPTPGQGLTLDLSGQIPATAARNIVLAPPQKYATTIDVVSSTTETDILQSAGYVIPGNTLGPTGTATVTIIGDYLNNTGAGVAGDLAVYFGGTKLYQNTGATINAIANRRPFKIELLLANLGVTNSQYLVGSLMLSDGNAAGTGLGFAIGPTLPAAAMVGWSSALFGISSTASIDTTLPQALRVTWKHGTSSVNASLRARFAIIAFA